MAMRWWALGIALASVGCGGDMAAPDAELTDGQALDGQALDAQALDAQALDAQALDGGMLDAQAVDANAADGGTDATTTMTDGGTDSALPPADGSVLGCADLATATTAQQIAIVTADTTCTNLFVQLLIANPAAHLPAFYALIASSATEALFFSVYAAMGAGTFVFDAAAIDDLYANMPAAIVACGALSRCMDWQTYIEGRLDIGELYRCPDPATLDRAGKLAVIPYGGYNCIESLAVALAPLSDDALITTLLGDAATGVRPWARRNALRIIGRFAGGATAAAAMWVTTTRRTDVLAMLHARLTAETGEDPMADIIWILDTYFYPDVASEPGLEALTEDTSRSSATRFRAAAALTRLLTAAGTIDAATVAFLIRNVTSDDPYVRAQIAFWVSTAGASAFPSGGLTMILNAIMAQYAIETSLQAEVYQARALDVHLGGTREMTLRTTYESTHLPNTYTRGSYTIRSGLVATELPPLVDLLDSETSAFPMLLGGSPFDTPVPSDPNPSMTLVVFATIGEYQEYMGGFVGFGSSAGGLYLEHLGTLFTYQRTPAESRFTLEELVQHEFGHYLQGRYVYPGYWGDPGDFDQPRGWADEGLAEVFAGLIYGAGTYTMPPRDVHLTTLCGTTPSLSTLFDLRAGYDQPGVFDYPGGWAYVYFLATTRPSGMHATYSALRDRSYVRANVASLAGSASEAALQSAYQSALDGWCAARPAGGGAAHAPILRARFESSAHVPSLPVAPDRPEGPPLRSDLLRR